MIYKRTNSKHLVSLVDIKKLAKDTVSYLIGNGHDLNGCTINPFGTLGVVEDVNGNHYLINDEGCADSEDAIEKKGACVAWYRKRITEDGYSFDVFPFVETSMTLDEFMPYITKKTQRLDTFVRTSGGDRLERNFANWDKFLTKGEL